VNTATAISKYSEENRTQGQPRREIHLASKFLNRAVSYPFTAGERDRIRALLVGCLANAFGVREDEVALLALDRRGQELQFVTPYYLARVDAALPFTANGSLAAKSLCTRTVLVENKLPYVNHLAHFEKVSVGNPRPVRLEKMLIVPIFIGKHPVGVVQISRKGVGLGHELPNFRVDQADLVLEIEPSICKLLQSCRK
jgi:hypothetical protein